MVPALSSIELYNLFSFFCFPAFAGSGNYEIISSANTYAQVCIVQHLSLLHYSPVYFLGNAFLGYIASMLWFEFSLTEHSTKITSGFKKKDIKAGSRMKLWSLYPDSFTFNIQLVVLSYV